MAVLAPLLISVNEAQAVRVLKYMGAQHRGRAQWDGPFDDPAGEFERGMELFEGFSELDAAEEATLAGENDRQLIEVRRAVITPTREVVMPAEMEVPNRVLRGIEMADPGSMVRRPASSRARAAVATSPPAVAAARKLCGRELLQGVAAARRDGGAHVEGLRAGHIAAGRRLHLPIVWAHAAQGPRLVAPHSNEPPQPLPIRCTPLLAQVDGAHETRL